MTREKKMDVRAVLVANAPHPGAAQIRRKYAVRVLVQIQYLQFKFFSQENQQARSL